MLNYEGINKNLEHELEELIIMFDPMIRYEKNVRAKENFRAFVRNK